MWCDMHSFKLIQLTFTTRYIYGAALQILCARSWDLRMQNRIGCLYQEHLSGKTAFHSVHFPMRTDNISFSYQVFISLQALIPDPSIRGHLGVGSWQGNIASGFTMWSQDTNSALHTFFSYRNDPHTYKESNRIFSESIQPSDHPVWDLSIQMTEHEYTIPHYGNE